MGLGEQDQYTNLTTQQQLKLRQLTVMSMAAMSKVKLLVAELSVLWIAPSRACCSHKWCGLGVEYQQCTIHPLQPLSQVLADH